MTKLLALSAPSRRSIKPFLSHAYQPCARRSASPSTLVQNDDFQGALGHARLKIKSAAVDSNTDADVDGDLSVESTFQELLKEYTAPSSTMLRIQKGHSMGRGLFLTKGADGEDGTSEKISVNSVLLSVPIDLCISVRYGGHTGVGNEAGDLKIPAGEWPRLRRGIAKNDALPWDVLQALALLDGLSGSGGDFWSRYTNLILPQPSSLSLPFCLPSDLLHALEHRPLIDAAHAQKERLADLFPGLAKPMTDEDAPTWIEWAFGCVRSRAFRLEQGHYAFVPFLDVANHAADPNAAFELAKDGRSVNLVCVKTISPGEEVTISYTGPQGATNRQMMAQYGFVPRLGNVFDRLQLSTVDLSENESSTKACLLSLDAMQAALGDGEDMVDAFSGKNPFSYAALKSLPFAAMESDAAPLADQLELARSLINELQEEQGLWKTSLHEDGIALMEIEKKTTSEEVQGIDIRWEMVLRYRYQRKQLVETAIRLLELFCHR